MSPDSVSSPARKLRSPASADLANLDILRSFAVCLVVISHFIMYKQMASRATWMGLTGVCLFFVHTCLVLMWSLERDPHTGRFYVRRMFRLFPLWLVVLAGVVLVHLPISPPTAPGFIYLPPSAGELLANATLTMNLWFGPSIVGASWSLPVEADMYLLLPLLFFFVRSTRAFWVLLVVDALAIVSVWCKIGIHASPETNLAVCIPYFLPGVMAYALTKKVRPSLAPWSFVVFLVAATCVEMFYGSIFYSSLFCLLIGLSIPFFRQVSWRPLVRGSHLVARYSYGIYLCHIPAMCVGLHYLRRRSAVVQDVAIVVVLVVSSVALYHLVEAPMIRLGSRLARRLERGPEPPMDEANMSLEMAP